MVATPAPRARVTLASGAQPCAGVHVARSERRKPHGARSCCAVSRLLGVIGDDDLAQDAAAEERHAELRAGSPARGQWRMRRARTS
jgi:hypothetical protein